MCGITGLVGHPHLDPTNRQRLDAMMTSLSHRGPDMAGRYDDEQVALGHRRLSIIDLETGKQPLANENETVWGIINGEIYNFHELRDDLIARGHRFRSTSDSECIVHLYEEYGEDCVQHLHGMFAFAIWDTKRQLLLLGRDRLGVKPLYYLVDDRRLVFGSELKAILAAAYVPREISAPALMDYLTFGFIPAPKTIFQNIHKLPAGSILTYRHGRAQIRRYWDLHHRGWTTEPLEVIVEQLWWHLRQATRPRLVADVPIGAFLSGGLDSTAVVASMAQLARNELVTLTCGFEEAAYDERPAAMEVAALLRTQHRELIVRPEAAESLDLLPRYFDEPFADASAVPTYYLSREARRWVTVALSGDGGDEALTGYRRYRFDQYEQTIRRWLPRFVQGILRPMAAVYPGRPWLPRFLRAGATLRNLAEDAATAHGLSIATLSPNEARRLLMPDYALECRDYDPLEQVRTLYHQCDAPDHLSKCQYVDLRLGLPDDMLVKVDRASMAHGLEVRSPMLDHRFLEYAWSIPPQARIHYRQGKYPLRLAVEQQLGRYIARRPKQGFELPLNEWFRGSLGARFQDEMLQTSTANGCFAVEEIKRIWRSHEDGHRRCGPTLWKLAMFQSWFTRYARGSAGPSEQVAPQPARIPSCIHGS